MSFRSLRDAIRGRTTNLTRTHTAQQHAQGVTRVFLAEEYSTALAERCTITYHEQDSTLTITASTKTFAHDITLHSQELAAHLRANRVPVKRIMVR